MSYPNEIPGLTLAGYPFVPRCAHGRFRPRSCKVALQCHVAVYCHDEGKSTALRKNSWKPNAGAWHPDRSRPKADCRRTTQSKWSSGSEKPVSGHLSRAGAPAGFGSGIPGQVRGELPARLWITQSTTTTWRAIAQDLVVNHQPTVALP